MRLEPVYLVAPKPRPPSMPTRRALLGMGLAFAVGGAIGSACGYSVGSAKAGDKATDAPSGASGEDYPLSGNAELDELRRLAVKAPIEELMGAGPRFVVLLTRRYREDEWVWRGVGRIAVELLRSPQPSRRRLAALVADTIQDAEPRQRDLLLRYVEQLRALK